MIIGRAVSVILILSCEWRSLLGHHASTAHRRRRVRTGLQTPQSRNDPSCAKFIEMAQEHFLTVLNLGEAILLGLYGG
jgi:hypothetical protein